MKQTRKMLLLLALLIPAGAMAQNNEQAIQMSRPAKVQRMTYEQMTEKMVSELQLDEKQTKMVTKLNKKYKTLIEGQQMERPLGQRPQNGNHPSGLVCKAGRVVVCLRVALASRTATTTTSNRRNMMRRSRRYSPMNSTKDI